LYVVDDEETESLEEDDDCCCVYVTEVQKIVEEGTSDEGPLTPGCLGNDVSLEAKPYPTAASFPDGEPHWTIQKPRTSDASLSPTSGSATTTVSGLDMYGEYTITAKCGSSDDGDSITIKFLLENETGWEAYGGSGIPGSCSPTWCDGEDSVIFDDCGNELEVSCAQSDGTGGLSGCAYRYFYNDDLISSCIWENGTNKWWYKEADIQGTNEKVFTKARHTTVDPDKFDDEGCSGYYCSLVTIYNCTTGTSTEYWRRSASSMPWTETDGEEHECEGP